MAVFLGIDVGTSATKAVAIDEQGKILAEASSEYESSHPRPTWSEQDPEDWWRATVEAVRRCTQIGAIEASSVRALGLTGQMHGAVFLDENNEVIRPAILWNDQRTTAECDDMESKCQGRKGLVQLVANRAITGFTAPKILWLRKHEPHNFERTRKILLPKDEIRRRLTGEFATDVSDASGMLLLDVSQRTWSRELLGILDLDIELLPRCYESTEVTGRLTKASAELLGLTQDCLVVAGAGDCPAGAIGTGIVRSGALSTSIGTSSVMMVQSDSCQIDPDGRIHTICHAVPGKWLMMGVNLSGGGCMQWFGQQLCKQERNEIGSSSLYQRLDEEARSVAAGSDGLMFLPYLSGERTPHFDADARGCFIGLTLAHTRGHMVRAIMEGVAFNMAGTLKIIRSLGTPVTEIRASGGGSRSKLWREIQAGAFGQPVVSINSEQGPSYGSALLATVGSGAHSSIEDACDAAIHVVGATESAAVEHYERLLPSFERMYFALRSEFENLARVQEQATPSAPNLVPTQ